MSKELKIKTAWLKALADKSTTWWARGLYQDAMQVSIPAMFMASTNAKVEFSGMDGGLRRRAVGVTWPVNFKASPNGRYERRMTGDSIKNAIWYTPKRRACYMHSLQTAYDTFIKGGGNTMARLPPTVKNSTSGLMAADFAEHVVTFLDERCAKCECRDATTKAALMKVLREHLSELAKAYGDQRAFNGHLDAAVASVLAFRTQSGRRSLAFRLDYGFVKLR